MKKICSNRALIQIGLSVIMPVSAAGAQNQAAVPAAATDAPNTGAAAKSDAQPQAPEAVTADIVVTAERRSVNLQKAPAAITVVDQASLTARGIQDLTSAQVLLPSARVGKSAVGTQLFFRGVGQKFDVPNSEPLVAVNMNGAGVAREALIGSDIYDVARIEGLPGPQGTLYGNAAVGGVLNIEFQRPVNEWQEHALLEKGNYDSTHLEGAVNAPISDIGGIRLAGNYNYADGYMLSGAGKIKDLSFRLSGKINPTERLSLFAWGMYSQTRGTTPNNTLQPNYNPSNIYDDITGAVPGAPIQPFAGENHSDLYIASGELAYDFGSLKLSYVPSYEKFDGTSLFYAAGASFSIFEHVRQDANELRLTNDPNSRLKIIAGLFESNQRYLNFLANSSRGPNSIVGYSRLTDISGYAQATYDLTDRLRLTGGGRYAIDRRLADYTEVIGALRKPETFQASYHHADYKGGAEFDLTHQSMLYGVVQSGYAPGTYPSIPDDARQTPAIKPSKLTSYTLGIKNRFFDRKVTFNVEGFYYDYRNLLVTNNNPITRTNEFFNAQRIVYEGAQVDAGLALDKFTEIHTTVGYLHARNKTFVVPGVATAAVPNPAPIDFSGLVPVFSPEWTVNAGASRSFMFRNASKLTFRVDTHYETGSYGAFELRPGTTDVGLSTYNPTFTKTDLSLTYYAPGERWRVGGWVRNVENTKRFTSLTGISSTVANGFPERPRTFGMSVGVDL